MEFKKKVEDVYDKESKDRVSLLNEIVHLKTLNERISEDAVNLTNALKGQSKTRGSWGEMILERVLEESGLQKGREYEVQTMYAREEGQRRHPDVIVHLPEGRITSYNVCYTKLLRKRSKASGPFSCLKK